MSRRLRIVGTISAVALLLASCGGGNDSSGRTKNSALCYATQEEKDAAVQAARDAFDAAMAGVPTEDAPEETPTSVEEETPTTISEDTTTTVALEEAGGGYRRPAVRTGSGGDTSTTVEEQSDGGEGDGEGEGNSEDGSLTLEQQQAQMDLEAAENMPLCETESSVVECTGTVTVEGASSDCGPVVLYVADDGAWHLDDEAQDPALVLAEGTVDVSALSAENPITFPISYEAASSDVQDAVSDQECLVFLNRWGFNWRCSEPVSVVITTDLWSSHANVAECISEGALLVPEDYRFYFAMYQSGDSPFFSGYNDEQQQDVEFSVGLPDSESACLTDEYDLENWDSLPFSGQSDVQVRNYEFTVPDDLGGPVYVKFESGADFDVDIDDNSDFEIDPGCDSDAECETYTGYSIWNLDPGTYLFEIEDNEEVVSWTSNVEIQDAAVTLPEVPFSYTIDGNEKRFTFTITQTQDLVFWATAGETCSVSEDDESGNGFADPEIDIIGSYGFEADDDNGGRGAGNCSASLIQETFEPGTYTLSVEDDDREGPSLTLGSSIELNQAKINWDLRSEFASPDTTFEIVVPSGGAWFRASTVINETVTYVYNIETDEEISTTGCANPDGDIETDDFNCPDSYLVLLDENENEVLSDDDGGEIYSVTRANGIATEVIENHYASDMYTFLEEGTYVLAVMDCCGPWDEEEPSTDTYEVKFGFGSIDAEDTPEIEVIVDENPEIPQSVEQVKLSDFQLTTDGSISTAISDGVESMVCDAECIDSMFASAGLRDGSIYVSAGADSVILRKGQKSAVIQVGKNAGEISAVATSADGSTVVVLSSELTKIPADIQNAVDNKTVVDLQSDSGPSMVLILMAIALLLIGAGAVTVRKKKSA